jgi:polyisoprenoid-binding protein YceI
VSAERVVFAPPTSTIAFTGAKVTGTHSGSFGTFTGTLDLNAAHPEQSRMRVEIDMASVTTDTERLTGHLKSPDFFDVAQFARSTFTSTTIAVGGANGATHTITGNFELHGQTRAVTFPATVNVSDTEVTARAEFVINRRDFGIVYAGMPDNLIRDEVNIRLNLRAPRGAGAPAVPPAVPAPAPTAPPTAAP